MQIKFLLLTALVGFLLTFTACKKEGRPSANSTGPDIYLAGTSNDAIAYWKNGKETDLTHGGIVANVHSIAVTANNDVYVTGNMFVGTPTNYTAAYWKNGQLNFLTDTSKNIGSGAYGIFIGGSDVYIAGSVNKDNGNAAYWKNGALKIVGGQNTSALSVFVSGGSPYIAGSTLYLTDNGSNNGTNSTYWNNNTAYNLTDVGNGEHINGSLTGLFVSGNDVYTAGSTRTPSDSHMRATYWKNFVANILSDPAFDANVTAMALSGNDICLR